MLDYAAFPKQRQALICQILQENGRVVCAELASRLNVSEHTIRRDLHELSREGYCKKVYGGAVMTLPEAGDYSERKEKYGDKKQDRAEVRKAGEARRLHFYRYRHHQPGDGGSAAGGAGVNGGHEFSRDRCRTAQKTAV